MTDEAYIEFLFEKRNLIQDNILRTRKIVNIQETDAEIAEALSTPAQVYGNLKQSRKADENLTRILEQIPRERAIHWKDSSVLRALLDAQQEEINYLLYSVLQTGPDIQAVLLEGYYIEQLPWKHVAKKLHISIDTVYRRRDEGIATIAQMWMLDGKACIGLAAII